MATRTRSAFSEEREFDGERLLTADEVAEIVGLTVDYVWALCRSDEIPHIRFGRARRFRRAAILAWLEGREQGHV